MATRLGRAPHVGGVTERGVGSALVAPGGRHIPALDGVRGVAILLVLLAHFSWGTPSSALDWAVARIQVAGWCGVDLFFVLSGFLITGILLDTRTLPSRFRRFYTRRVLRIFPLYYAALVALLILLPLASAGFADNMKYVVAHQAWYWLYLNNILAQLAPAGAIPLVVNHFWSLALEEQFYLVWPALVFLLRPRLLLRVCAALFAVSALLGGIWWWLGPDAAGRPWSALALYGRAGGLVLGGLVAILQRSEHAPRVLAAVRPVAAFSLATIAAIALYQGDLEWTPLLLSVGIVALQFAFAAFVVAAGASSANQLFGRVLRSRFLMSCGKYSYGIYVVHPLAMVLVVRKVLEPHADTFARLGYIPTQLVVAGLAGLVTALVALASWHLLEKHFLKLKDNLAPRPRNANAALLHPDTVEA